MEISVLGAFAAELGGRPVTPTAAKHRQLLAMLALHAGQVVSTGALIDELWDEHPPRSARTTLQTYVMQVRRRIADGMKDVLVTTFGGYRLDVDRADLDANRFERLAADGRAAADAGIHDAAVPLLTAALALWRGPALVDVPTGPTLAVEVARLEEGRLGALEARIAAEVHRGRHHAVLGDLAVLTARHPLHENLCALHMAALAGAGRPGQALQAFRRLRSAMIDELGVEPSPRLQRLHRSILLAGAPPATARVALAG